jgi:hypothetical protein
MKSNNYAPYGSSSGPYNNTSYLRQSNGSTFDNVDSNRSSASAYHQPHQSSLPPAPPATYYNGTNSFYIQQKQEKPIAASSNPFRENSSYQYTSNTTADQPLNPLNLSSYNRYTVGGQHVTVTHQIDGKIKDIHVIDVDRNNQTPLIQ